MIVDMSILLDLGFRLSCVFLKRFADNDTQNGKCKERRYQAKTNLAALRNVRTEAIRAIVAALYTLEPSCRRRGGACTAEGAHKTPRRLLRLKEGASNFALFNGQTSATLAEM